MGRYSLLWACCALAACRFTGTGKAGPGDDVDSGVPDAPNQCTPNEAECAGPNTLRVCHDDGMGADDTDCPAGCIETPEAHCGSFTPSNGVTFSDAGATVDTTGVAQWIFLTDTGQIIDGDDNEIRAAGEGIDADTEIGFTIVAQSDAGSPSIGVFEMASLSVAADTEVRGRGINALAFAVSGPVTIAGVIEASGGNDACFSGGPVNGQRCAGPGASSGGDTQQDGEGLFPGTAGENNAGEGGGGGGAFGSDGGGGGDATSSSGGSGGTAEVSTAPIPLLGGSGGGGGGTEEDDACPPLNPPFPGGPGGGGGGAIQLTALGTITFVAGATCGINAGGGGGDPGQCRAAGGGAGSGGSILVEAPAVTLVDQCVLAANGGGGGGANAAFDGPGDDGRLGTNRARGSNAFQNDGSDGGDGATASSTAQTANNNSGQAGGGGGGLGIILVRAPSDARDLQGDTSPNAGTADLTIE